MPLFTPPGPVLLDVTLSRDGIFRRWTIHAGELPDYWSCRLLTPTSVTLNSDCSLIATGSCWPGIGPWPSPSMLLIWSLVVQWC